jgi:hypothetical protein
MTEVIVPERVERVEENVNASPDDLHNKLANMGFSLEKIEHVLALGVQDLQQVVDLLLSEPPSDGNQICSICQTATNENFINLLDCNDIFCKDCLYQYVKYRIEECQVLTMPCPNHECRSQIDEPIIKHLVSEALYEKYKAFKQSEELSKNPYHRWCPQPDCTGYDIGTASNIQLSCNICKFSFCFYCQEPWHATGKCKFESEKEMQKWAKNNGVKICPNCRRKVEKNLGCDHMTCSKCRYEWCWLCGDKYSSSHMQTCEVIMLNKKNPKIDMVLKLIAAPLMLPILCVILCCMVVYKNRIENGSVFVNKHKALCYFLAVLVGIVMTPVFLAVSPFVVAIGICGDFFYDRCCSKICGCLTGVFFGVVAAPLVVTGALLTAVVCHFAGIVLVVWKVYVLIRRCWDPMYLKPKNNYRF